MRIVLFSTYDLAGGAARAAHRLHRGLLALGHTSHLLVRQQAADETEILRAALDASSTSREQLRRLGSIQCYGIDHNRTELSNTFFTLPEPGYDLSAHPLVRVADVLHLHWVAGLLSPASIARLQGLGKPIVWTLHDQRPFTGGCHYSAGCANYQIDCAACPQLRRDEAGLTKTSLADARQLLRACDLTVVSPSRWLADCARRSALFKDTRIEVIPNGLDTGIFRPQPKAAARARLGLEHDGVWFLFGADNCDEKRKGFVLLRDALRLCLKNADFRQAVERRRAGLLCFGGTDRRFEELGLPIRSLGPFTSEDQIAALYSAADVFLLPSHEDNLPNTLIEAMCCGTPAIAQRIGGVPEVVTDDRTGLLAEPGDPQKFADAMLALAFDAPRRERLRMYCRQEIPPRFVLKQQAGQYARLYEELCAVPVTAAAPAAPPTVNCKMMDAGPGFAGITRSLLRVATKTRRAERGGLRQRLQREWKRLLSRSGVVRLQKILRGWTNV